SPAPVVVVGRLDRVAAHYPEHLAPWMCALALLLSGIAVRCLAAETKWRIQRLLVAASIENDKGFEIGFVHLAGRSNAQTGSDVRGIEEQLLRELERARRHGRFIECAGRDLRCNLPVPISKAGCSQRNGDSLVV